MELPKRKLIRLKDYDYSSNGAYFVTICTYNRAYTLCDICRDDPCGRPLVIEIKLGRIARQQITRVETRYQIKVDKYVIMPNHIHMIISINNPDGNGHPQGVSLQRIVGGYKSYVSSEYLKICKEKSKIMGEIWRIRYYEHVIRNEESYQEIWEYIDTNPMKWAEDCYHTH